MDYLRYKGLRVYRAADAPEDARLLPICDVVAMLGPGAHGPSLVSFFECLATNTFWYNDLAEVREFPCPQLHFSPLDLVGVTGFLVTQVYKRH